MRSFWGIVVALVATGSLAYAELPPMKAPPPELTHEHLRMWGAAKRAERKGDFAAAGNQYYSLLERTLPDPAKMNVLFNLALMYARTSSPEAAARTFTKYLELVPHAADGAQIKKLIAELGRGSRWTMLKVAERDNVDPGAQVYVDGDHVGPAPGRFPADNKEHTVARIGRSSVVVGSVRSRSSSSSEYLMGDRTSLATEGGNVYIDFFSKSAGEFELDGRPAQVNSLLALRAGRYSTSFGPGKLCDPITFDVKAGSTLTYVYVGAEGGVGGRYGCWTVTKLRVHHLPWGTK